jgi:hypothetical protein
MSHKSILNPIHPTSFFVKVHTSLQPSGDGVSRQFMCAKSHENLDDIAKGLTSGRGKRRVAGTVLAGREKLCMHPSCSGAPAHEQEERCKALLKNGGCKLSKPKTRADIRPYLSGDVEDFCFMSIQKLRSLPEKNEADELVGPCPFFTSDMLMEEAFGIGVAGNLLLGNNVNLLLSNNVNLIGSAARVIAYQQQPNARVITCQQQSNARVITYQQ